MREAIGGTWIFQIVIFFILLFTGYMCLSINHSKAFNVKNEIVKAIEREGGVDLQDPTNDPAIQQIVEYLKKTSYRTTGKCEDIKDKHGNITTMYYRFDRNGKPVNNNPAFCIGMQTKPNGDGDLPDMSYYRIVVFYQLDLPIFRSVFNFKISGDTKLLSHTNGYRITPDKMCQNYRNGKKVGSPVPCSSVSGQIIGG